MRSDAKLQSQNEQAGESRGVLFRGQRNRQRHAGRDCAIEVDHPLQLVGHKQVRTVRMNAGRRIGIRVGGGVGAGVERKRDRRADGLERLRGAVESQYDEAVGELPDLRRLRSRSAALSAGSAGKTTNATESRHGCLGRRGSGCVGEVERDVAGQ